MVVFVAHSFLKIDQPIISIVIKTIKNCGFLVSRGTENNARSLSEEIKHKIDLSDVFVAVFTCRYYVEIEGIWTTSPWVIEEKGYFLGSKKNNPLIVFVEKGISVPAQIGGLQGDIEYYEFDRFKLDELQVKLKKILVKIKNSALAACRTLNTP